MQWRKTFLLDKIKFSGLSIKQINCEYSVSTFVLYKIKDHFENDAKVFKKLLDWAIMINNDQ